MDIKHGCGKVHEAWLCDDGTLDTVISVDGHEVRYDGDYAAEVARDQHGCIKRKGLRRLAIEACDDGLLDI